MAWALLGALFGAIAAVATQPNEIAAQWRDVVAVDGLAYWSALAWFAFDALLPLVLLMVISAILFGLVIGAAGLVVSLLPHRLASLVDGLTMGGTIMGLLELLQLSPTLRDLPGGRALDLLSIWFIMIALSGLVWKHLPWNLTYRHDSQRVIAVPITQARDRLVPHRVPGIALADAAIGGHDPEMPANWQPVMTRREGADRHRVDEPAGALPWRRMRYRLDEPRPGQTRVAIDIEINALSPLAWWDFATRPYGEDFLDHLEARLTDRPDRSTYGWLAEKQRKSALRGAHMPKHLPSYRTGDV